MQRTDSPSQGGDTGSNPVGTALYLGDQAESPQQQVSSALRRDGGPIRAGLFAVPRRRTSDRTTSRPSVRAVINPGSGAPGPRRWPVPVPVAPVPGGAPAPGSGSAGPPAPSRDTRPG